MRRNGVYTIDYYNGKLILSRVDDSYLTTRIGIRSLACDIIMNPYTEIENGVLYVKANRYTYKKIVNTGDDGWEDMKVSDLDDNWKDEIYYDLSDIYHKNLVTKFGFWPFREKVIQSNVKHLKAGYYMNKKNPKEIEITTSNFIIHD